MKKALYSTLLFLLTSSLIYAQGGVGIGTKEPKALLHVDTGAVVFSGMPNTLSAPDNAIVSGEGTRFLWYPKKAALRAGMLYGAPNAANWNKDSIGTGSMALGVNTRAKGHGAVAVGYFTKASGDYSFAAGGSTHALSSYSTALGTDTEAGFAAFAAGIGSSASGEGSTAMGVSCQSLNRYSVAIGQSLVSKAGAGIVFGSYNDVTDNPGSAYDYVGTDRLFQIGNGSGQNARSNAVTVLRNGNTGIGELTPEARLHITHNSGTSYPQLLLEEPQNDYVRLSFKNATTNNVWSIAASPNVTGGTAQMNFFYQSYGDVLKLFGNGNATLTGTLTQNSDARLKTNITPFNGGVHSLEQLSGYRYRWKDSTRPQGVQIGLLAQEVQTVFPELVLQDEKGTLSVNYNGLVPVLIEAVKELKKENCDLKVRLEKLEQQLLKKD